ncbi:hypothetical protein [Helicobacter sp. MIT 05-5294]|nr:hypothetical protein [Helicobacter sp. MIT 05-5294]
MLLLGREWNRRISLLKFGRGFAVSRIAKWNRKCGIFLLAMRLKIFIIES